jgi:acetyl esterase
MHVDEGSDAVTGGGVGSLTSITMDPRATLALDHVDRRVGKMGPPRDLAEARAQFVELLGSLRVPTSLTTEGMDVVSIDLASNSHTVRTRSYTPVHCAGRTDDVVVYLHGGGWNSGDLETAHPNAIAVARATERHVVAVDYRLAPEFPFPAGLEDCLSVVRFLRQESESRRVFLAGDSSGANLAAAVAVATAREHRVGCGRAIAGQLLFYPPMDSSCNRGSYARHATACFLTAEGMRENYRLYLRDAESIDQALLDPWLAPEGLPLPPTVLAAAGFDPLADDAVAYAHRLLDAGTPVVYLPAPTLPHGWLEFVDLVPAALRERDAALAAFRTLIDTCPDGIGAARESEEREN